VILVRDITICRCLLQPSVNLHHLEAPKNQKTRNKVVYLYDNVIRKRVFTQLL